MTRESSSKIDDIAMIAILICALFIVPNVEKPNKGREYTVYIKSDRQAPPVGWMGMGFRGGFNYQYKEIRAINPHLYYNELEGAWVVLSSPGTKDVKRVFVFKGVRRHHEVTLKPTQRLW